MIWYRHNDRRFPFLWEDASQPPARWHAEGAGPAHYFADTPDGAWAEFLRHEEIVDEADLEGISRAIWAVEVPDHSAERPALPTQTCTGGVDTYPACQAEAARLRAAGAVGFIAPSAALMEGRASGWRVERGFQPGPPADGQVLVLFEQRPDLIGWQVVDRGRPPGAVLAEVNSL